ncbi:MAG: acyl-CoA dehydrogenase family protein [Deltaproteobacteria bacterium]|nr:acyl-CoA dehydrogenase family protein [Deltaproteobacteria bacterium]MBW1819099.1 acyl-CoA dehydrogenase family protein [Deltaproteobacteria bacterium]
MDPFFTEKQRLFRQEVRAFAKKELTPFAEAAEETETFPMELWKILGQSGYLGIRFPEEYGGMGEGLVSYCIFIEEMNRVSAGLTAGIGLQAGMATLPVYLFGNEDQRQQWLVPAIRGEKVSAFALTEPGAGSDAANIACTAKREGDDYVINGTKLFITNGGIADFVVVAAKTDPSKGVKGITLLVVEKGTSGFAVVRKLRKMATRGSETAELSFKDCRVPGRNRLGQEGVGFVNLMKSLNEGRLSCAASALGIAHSAFNEALNYAKRRKAFGKSIGALGAIQSYLANMSMDIEAGRLLTYNGAWMADQEQEYTKEASWAKLYTSEMVQRVANKAVQVFGGYGFIRDYAVERHYREARLWEIVEGTSEIQRLIIARNLGLK